MCVRITVHYVIDVRGKWNFFSLSDSIGFAGSIGWLHVKCVLLCDSRYQSHKHDITYVMFFLSVAGIGAKHNAVVVLSLLEDGNWTEMFCLRTGVQNCDSKLLINKVKGFTYFTCFKLFLLWWTQVMVKTCWQFGRQFISLPLVPISKNKISTYLYKFV